MPFELPPSESNEQQFLSNQEAMASLQSEIVMKHSEVAEMLRVYIKLMTASFQHPRDTEVGKAERKQRKKSRAHIKAEVTVGAASLRQLLARFDQGRAEMEANKEKLSNVFLRDEVRRAVQSTLANAETLLRS